MGELLFFVVIFGLIFCFFWVAQLVDLMRRADNEFPGRHDKIVWAAIIVLVPVLGAIAYSIWKPIETRSPSKLEREWNAIQSKRRNPESGNENA